MKFSLWRLYNDVKPRVNNSEDVILCIFEMRSEWACGQGKRTRIEAAAAVPVAGIKKSPKRQKKQCAPYVPQSAVIVAPSRLESSRYMGQATDIAAGRSEFTAICGTYIRRGPFFLSSTVLTRTAATGSIFMGFPRE
jgi:hypothetical protein